VDKGYLEIDSTRLDVSNVRMIDNQIRHYSTQDCKELLGKSPKLIIDYEKRLLHAKLHTSGHLISNIIERDHPKYKAIKGHQLSWGVLCRIFYK
jgi:Ser-tRNA(Ala) deacylase AlaX